VTSQPSEEQTTTVEEKRVLQQGERSRMAEARDPNERIVVMPAKWLSFARHPGQNTKAKGLVRGQNGNTGKGFLKGPVHSMVRKKEMDVRHKKKSSKQLGRVPRKEGQ